VAPPAPASLARTSINVCIALRKNPKTRTMACNTRIRYPIQPRAASETVNDGTKITLKITVKKRTIEKMQWYKFI
jgi:hypothetical protein